MSKTKLQQKLSNAASVVREVGRDVREVASHTAEYALVTIKGVVKHIEDLYPQTGLGEAKLELAKDQLEAILGEGYIESRWPKIAKQIANIVRIEKLVKFVRAVR